MSDALTTDQLTRLADSKSESSHTPGPWSVGDTADTELMVYCDDSLGSRVANCLDSGHGIARRQDHANARLIAAAPDLLAALRACADSMAIAAARNERLAINEPSLLLAVEAIAKAKGKL